MMILIDSSIWVSILKEDDSQHEKGVRIIESIDEKNITIFDYTYSETLTVLKQKSSLKTCFAFLKLLEKMNLDVTVSDVPQIELANRLFFTVNNKLSFVDCLLLATAKINNARLITFDKELEKLYNPA